jgi:MATE family multidrug resistance protein
MVVGQLAFASMGFIDTILMGSLGVNELAGGGLGSMVFQFFHVVGIGVLIATSNLIAFAKGSGDDTEIHASLLSGVIMTVLLSIVFGAVIWYAPSILVMMGQDPLVVEVSSQYLSVIVWALLPAFLFILFRSLALGIGDPSAVLPISILAAVSNYPISYVLMHGMFGLPALGVQGVALGTLIVACIMSLGIAFMLYQKEHFKPFKLWKNWQQFSFHNTRETVRLGVPIAVAHAMEIGLFSAAALLIGTLGAQALAAHQVVLQCVTMSFMLPLGLSQAVSVKVGKHYGAKRKDEVRQTIFYGMMLASATSTVAGLIFWLFPEALVNIFVSEADKSDFASVLALASSLLFVGALFQLVDGWQVVLMGVLRGFKLGASPTIVAVVSYWGVGFPCAYFLMEGFGAVGVWAGLGIGLACSAVLLSGLLVRTFKRAF